MKLDTRWAAVAAAALAGAAQAQLTTTTVATGLARPVHLTQPPGDDRIFLIEQRTGSTGRVRILAGSTLLPNAYLSLTVSTLSEQGLLGLAFHPDFATNRHLFVNYTRPDGDTVIARFTQSGTAANQVDLASQLILLVVDQPESNHNGGTIAFGADGYLYIGMGDGGGGFDPRNAAQNIESPLGKFLRIDVDRDDFPSDPLRNYGIPSDNPFASTAGLDEIWSYGLRNPWKWGFDARRLGGFDAMHIEDVGQEEREEINWEPFGTGGRNYGWLPLEGTRPTGIGTPSPSMTPPIYEYTHADGCSISGGVVYRGARLGPDYWGRLFFGDYCGGWVRSLELTFDPLTGAAVAGPARDEGIGAGFGLMAVAQDASGEMYMLRQNGEVRRITRSDPNRALGVQVTFEAVVPDGRRPRHVSVTYRRASQPDRAIVAGLPPSDALTLPLYREATSVYVSAPGFLKRRFDFAAGASDPSPLEVALLNGDVTRDDRVDIDDFLVLASAYETAPGDPNYAEAADLNGDGPVDLDDFLILSANYERAGES